MPVPSHLLRSARRKSWTTTFSLVRDGCGRVCDTLLLVVALVLSRDLAGRTDFPNIA
jgi:hypothetical protein